MSLAVGKKLGVFEISTLLGVGGMGEVYRARDTKLGREVAIKVLPEEFANDRDRLARSAGKLQHWPADRRPGPWGVSESTWSLKC